MPRLPAPNPRDPLHRQRRKRYADKERKGAELSPSERGWVREYERARSRAAAPASAPAAAPSAEAEFPTVTHGPELAAAGPELAAPAAAPPPLQAAAAAAGPAPAPVPPLEGAPLALASSSAPAAAGEGGPSAELLKARAVALRSLLGFAAEGFREMHQKVAATMGDDPFPFGGADFWRDVWLPLTVDVLNRHLPEVFSGPIIEGASIVLPPVTVVRAARRLEKAGYKLGEPGEPGREAKASDKRPERPERPPVAAPARAERNGGINPRDIFARATT